MAGWSVREVFVVLDHDDHDAPHVLISAGGDTERCFLGPWERGRMAPLVRAATLTTAPALVAALRELLLEPSERDGNGGLAEMAVDEVERMAAVAGAAGGGEQLSPRWGARERAGSRGQRVAGGQLTLKDVASLAAARRVALGAGDAAVRVLSSAWFGRALAQVAHIFEWVDDGASAGGGSCFFELTPARPPPPHMALGWASGTLGDVALSVLWFEGTLFATLFDCSGGSGGGGGGGGGGNGSVPLHGPPFPDVSRTIATYYVPMPPPGSIGGAAGQRDSGDGLCDDTADGGGATAGAAAAAAAGTPWVGIRRTVVCLLPLRQQAGGADHQLKLPAGGGDRDGQQRPLVSMGALLPCTAEPKPRSPLRTFGAKSKDGKGDEQEEEEEEGGGEEEEGTASSQQRKGLPSFDGCDSKRADDGDDGEKATPKKAAVEAGGGGGGAENEPEEEGKEVAPKPGAVVAAAHVPVLLHSWCFGAPPMFSSRGADHSTRVALLQEPSGECFVGTVDLEGASLLHGLPRGRRRRLARVASRERRLSVADLPALVGLVRQQREALSPLCSTEQLLEAAAGRGAGGSGAAAPLPWRARGFFGAAAAGGSAEQQERFGLAFAQLARVREVAHAALLSELAVNGTMVALLDAAEAAGAGSDACFFEFSTSFNFGSCAFVEVEALISHALFASGVACQFMYARGSVFVALRDYSEEAAAAAAAAAATAAAGGGSDETNGEGNSVFCDETSFRVLRTPFESDDEEEEEGDDEAGGGGEGGGAKACETSSSSSSAVAAAVAAAAAAAAAAGGGAAPVGRVLRNYPNGVEGWAELRKLTLWYPALSSGAEGGSAEQQPPTASKPGFGFGLGLARHVDCAVQFPSSPNVAAGAAAPTGDQIMLQELRASLQDWDGGALPPRPPRGR